MTPTARKRSNFKNYSTNFWINERGAHGCRYQCKHCGKVTLGMYGVGLDAGMHYSTCALNNIPPRFEPAPPAIVVRTVQRLDGTSCNACSNGEAYRVLVVDRQHLRFCARCFVDLVEAVNE